MPGRGCDHAAIDSTGPADSPSAAPQTRRQTPPVWDNRVPISAQFEPAWNAISSYSTYPFLPLPPATRLGRAAWQRDESRGGRSRRKTRRTCLRDRRLCRRRGALRARAYVLRQPRRAPFSRLRDAALRTDFAATGSPGRPAAVPVPTGARRARDAGRRSRRALGAPAAAGLHCVAIVELEGRRPVRARRDDQAPLRARLPARGAGSRTRRLRSSRSRVRRVRGRQRCAGAHRPVRQRDRDAAYLRSADTALGRQTRSDRDPAGARVPVRRCRNQVIPRAFPGVVPGRAGPLPCLPDDLRRPVTGRRRVLLADVLLGHSFAVRLLGRRHVIHRRRRRPRRARYGLAIGRGPLRAIAR